MVWTMKMISLMPGRPSVQNLFKEMSSKLMSKGPMTHFTTYHMPIKTIRMSWKPWRLEEWTHKTSVKITKKIVKVGLIIR
jgi:hypothetical protein